MMSDSSNEDATSPISSPSSKKPDLSLASSKLAGPLYHSVIKYY